MPAAFPIRWQLSQRPATTQRRLVVALVISLVVHALVYTGWRVAPVVTSFVNATLAKWRPVKREELRPQPQPQIARPLPKREVPLVFVEVDPALASATPPKETPNYSTHDSLAANPEPKKLDVPKIDGSQTRVTRTTDNPKPQPKPMQPAPTPAPPEPKPKEPDPVEPKPPANRPVGDLAMTKVQPQPLTPSPPSETVEKPVEKPRDKPRTLREAMMRNPSLAGQKMQQEGGVERRARVSMLDAKGSPFGNYDNVFIAMVQERWYGLLENNRFQGDRHGKVSLTFKLHYDGRITVLETAENSVGDVLGLLCQKAILDPAPFPKWPSDMRKLVGTDVREVRFTFFYD